MLFLERTQNCDGGGQILFGIKTFEENPKYWLEIKMLMELLVYVLFQVVLKGSFFIIFKLKTKLLTQCFKSVEVLVFQAKKDLLHRLDKQVKQHAYRNKTKL